MNKKQKQENEQVGDEGGKFQTIQNSQKKSWFYREIISKDIFKTSPKFSHWFKVLSKFISIQLIVQALGFASGILIIRTLSKDEYAYFTIANSLQGMMNVLTDSGISIGLTSIGGKVWQDKYRFGQLINTAMQLRRYLAIVSIIVVTPILLWILINSGASISYAITIILIILAELYFYLINGILGVVPRLNSQIKIIQNLDLIFSGSRLVLLCITYFTFLNAAIAAFISMIASGLQSFLIKRWVKGTIDTKADISIEYKKNIVKIIKAQYLIAVYSCVQGQIPLLLLSLFGNTKNIAELGALGRLGIIFTIINSVMTSIVLPGFARCQSSRLLYRRYCQIILLNCILGFVLVGCTGIFSTQLLSILGEKYNGLHWELTMITFSIIFGHIGGTMWALNSTKGWIKYAWLYPPTTIVTQTLLLFIVNVSNLRGVLIFSIISMIPSFIINIMLSYNGLRDSSKVNI
jgi:O-antigen/teichoic acid export membrane protein